MNMAVALVRQHILVDLELRILGFDNHNVIDSKRKLVMELKHLALQVPGKLARCAVSYAVASRQLCSIYHQTQLFAQTSGYEHIRGTTIVHRP